MLAFIASAAFFNAVRVLRSSSRKRHCKAVSDAALKIWDYHRLKHPLPEHVSVILVFCSHDTRIAKYAAKLFLEARAHFILFSGGMGSGPHSGANLHGWTRPEAEIFADIARDCGVPTAQILIENRSTNSGQNVSFSKELLAERGINVKSVLIVQKPFMERRAYATFKKVWPEISVVSVSSPPIPLLEYPNEELSLDTLINIMVGDTQRIPLYAEKGFQIPQPMPPEVWRAFEELVEYGYTWNLCK